MKDVYAIEWETVHTVHDYFDGPRNGVAEYHGVPHAFKCEWDDAADDWSPVFRLSPINDEQLSAIKEDWSIWLRYRTTFLTGSLQPDDRHPALSVDWERHEQLRGIVDAALNVDVGTSVKAIPEFRGSIEPIHEFEVRWLPDDTGS